MPALAGDPGSVPERIPDAGAALCVQFTSGTTSRPKAVLYTHANAPWGGRVGSSHAHLGPDDVVLVYAPLFHLVDELPASMLGKINKHVRQRIEPAEAPLQR